MNTIILQIHTSSINATHIFFVRLLELSLRLGEKCMMVYNYA
jgi:hypothetical protein